MEYGHLKYSIIYYFSIILLIFGLISLFINILHYCLLLSSNAEENNQAIMPVLYSFSFDYSSTKNPEYYERLPNLGYTGKPIYDCYIGKCQYYQEYECEEESCDPDSGHCTYRTTTCKRYTSSFQYKSSLQCRDNKGKYCDKCSEMKDYTLEKCSCSHSYSDDDYLSSYYCTADNVILNWKNYYYDNSTGYISYLKDVVPSNKECQNDMKQCGILDELGNKLCVTKSFWCPINYITLNPSDRNYTYKNITIDGVTIYYTNEAIYDGRVVGGFYVDSDLKINYNIGDCQIITTSKISELMNSHANKLYKKSLTFDPYKDKDIDKRGKAYLKWCIPGVGKEKNITLIKKLYEIYQNNQTINEVLYSSKRKYKEVFFVSLGGKISIIIILMIIILSLRYRKLCFIPWSNILFPFQFFFYIVDIIIFFEIRADLSKVNKLNQNILNVHITFFVINICLFFIFTISYIILLYFLCKLYNKEKNTNENNSNHQQSIDKDSAELKMKYDNNANNDEPSNTNINPLIPEGLTNE